MNVGGDPPPHVFVVWLGPGSDEAPAMSRDRARCLDLIQENVGLDVVLVTEDQLDDLQASGHPFHPAFRFLSANHKSDYLRSYLLHHYGGGYTDVKVIEQTWAPSLELLQGSPRLCGIGYQESSPSTVAPMNVVSGRSKAQRLADRDWLTYRLLRLQYRRLLGNGGFIFRPHSSFTERWLRTVERRLDHYQPELARHLNPRPLDGKGLVVDGVASQYPIPWTDLMGNVFHPLTLRYSHWLANSLPRPRSDLDYR